MTSPKTLERQRAEEKKEREIRRRNHLEQELAETLTERDLSWGRELEESFLSKDQMNEKEEEENKGEKIRGRATNNCRN